MVAYYQTCNLPHAEQSPIMVSRMSTSYNADSSHHNVSLLTAVYGDCKKAPEHLTGKANILSEEYNDANSSSQSDRLLRQRQQRSNEGIRFI